MKNNDTSSVFRPKDVLFRVSSEGKHYVAMSLLLCPGCEALGAPNSVVTCAKATRFCKGLMFMPNELSCSIAD